MTMYQRIKNFYNEERWTKPMVWDAVRAKAITADEYLLIIGEVYNKDRRPVEVKK